MPNLSDNTTKMNKKLHHEFIDSKKEKLHKMG